MPSTRQLQLITLLLSWEAVGAQQDDFFKSCGKDSSCFALGKRSKVFDNCWVGNDCAGALRVLPPIHKDSVFQFSLRLDTVGQPTKGNPRYVAIGISTRHKIWMQDLLIFECGLAQDPGQTKAYMSYSKGATKPTRLAAFPTGVVATEYPFNSNNGSKIASCDFSFTTGRFHHKLKGMDDRKYNLNKDWYYIAIAVGRVVVKKDDKNNSNASGSWAMKKHLNKYISPTKYNLKVINPASNYKSNPLQNLHAFLMTLAYFTLMPIATLIARFFRETWASKHILKKRVWFFVHATLLSTTVIVVISGYLAMFIDTKEVRPKTAGPQRHSNIGFTSIGILLLQASVPWFIPSKYLTARQIYSKIHAACGTICYCTGLINIAMVPVTMPKYHGCSLILITAIWAACHTSIYILLTTLLIIKDHEMIANNTRFRALTSYPMRIKTLEDASGTGLRKIFLGIHVTLSLTMLVVASTQIFSNSYCLPWYDNPLSRPPPHRFNKTK